MIKCPNCDNKIDREPDGMCCNSGADSGYQYHCGYCNVWFVDTFDGRQLLDDFLTVCANKGKDLKTGKFVKIDKSREMKP